MTFCLMFLCENFNDNIAKSNSQPNRGPKTFENVGGKTAW